MAQSDVINQLAQRLHPISECSDDKRAEIVAAATLVRMDSDQLICREGDRDKFCIYLVKGGVETLSSGQRVKAIRSGSEAASLPLAEHQPRTLSVRTLTPVGLLRIPRDLMDTIAIPDGREDGIALSELDEGGDNTDD